MPRRKGLSKNVTRDVALRQFKADVFAVLAHPTRIHIVECLRDGERSVSELIEQIQVEPANASQHLAVLRSKELVVTRKEGNLVFYALRDPALALVLLDMRKLFANHIRTRIGMLESMAEDGGEA
jgi:DNA-binding transcriptional ArsR family regulator